MKSDKILIIGCGFAGATIARVLAEAGLHVEIIDKRNHIGGNAFDFTDSNGIRVHKYGPHIFHTSNLKIVKWLNNFTEWIPYNHKVLAKIKPDEFHILPINKTTSEKFTKEEILDIFYRPYTFKMWGMHLEEINPNIIDRVPIRNDHNELYFPNDEFQAIPKNGYTKLFENLLNHKNIKIFLSQNYTKGIEHKFTHCFNSMAIDEFYDYCYGELPYRSIKFESITIPESLLYKTAVTNFTTYTGPTRVTEWKHFYNYENIQVTTLTYEYPCDYKDNNNERFYPINDLHGTNKERYNLYKKINNNQVTFIGRCGNYLYLDMHQVISSSLALAENYLKTRNKLNVKLN